MTGHEVFRDDVERIVAAAGIGCEHTRSDVDLEGDDVRGPLPVCGRIVVMQVVEDVHQDALGTLVIGAGNRTRRIEAVPDGCRIVGRISDEPLILLVVCRTGLTGRGDGLTVIVLDHTVEIGRTLIVEGVVRTEQRLFQDLVHHEGCVRSIDDLVVRAVREQLVTVDIQHLGIGVGLGPQAATREDGEGGGHLKRRHTLVEAADSHRDLRRVVDTVDADLGEIVARVVDADLQHDLGRRYVVRDLERVTHGHITAVLGVVGVSGVGCIGIIRVQIDHLIRDNRRSGNLVHLDTGRIDV